MTCSHENYSLNPETWVCRCTDCGHRWAMTPAEVALTQISAQAVCVNMDGDAGNERMLRRVYELAEAALTSEHKRLHGASH